ncbi:imm11 family protein [Bradyrhizobium sp. HKCCYLS2038]
MDNNGHRKGDAEMLGGDRANPPAGERKYYTLEIDYAGASRLAIHQWVNKSEQMKGFHPAHEQPFRGLRFAEPPQIEFVRSRKLSALRDAESVTLGIWLISDRLKNLIEQLDAEAFVFQPVIVDYSRFPEAGPAYWFVYIMRTLDCVDEERSVIRYQDDPPGIKNYLGLGDVRMRPEVVGSAHAFRLIYATTRLIVDDIIVDALRAEKIRGFRFQPIQA